MPFKLLGRKESSGDMQALASPPSPTKLVPQKTVPRRKISRFEDEIQKFAERLEEITGQEENIKGGISLNVFQTRVLPEYPALGARVFAFIQRVTHHEGAGPIPAAAFLQVTERLMSVMSDERQTELYIKMYADAPHTDISREHFYELAAQSHYVALDHYPDGARCCRYSKSTLEALTSAAFHGKDTVPLSYMVHWVQEHTPRLLLGLHRYVVHHLNTAYRSIDQPLANGCKQQEEESMDLGTPVLEREIGNSGPGEHELMPPLPLSQVWLLAVSLPKTYMQPSVIHSPSNSSGLASLDSQGLIARWLGTICPSHWTPLYNSDLQGLGANRFLTHVLSYRGPTLVMVRGEQGVEFCIGSTDEWHESHQYWGGEECVMLQTKPQFHFVERGAKLLYLNTTIRGYPHGLRVGLDPRKPSLSINEGFTQVEYKGIPYPLLSIEVWGCGNTQNREAQLDIKKWQVKQAERQRQVKLTAVDWVNHPDRYLLELGGRTTYNNDCT